MIMSTWNMDGEQGYEDVNELSGRLKNIMIKANDDSMKRV